MQTTLAFELVRARILGELSDYPAVPVVPYAGQDKPGKNGEPVVTLPLVTLRFSVEGIVQMGRGMEQIRLRIEVLCLSHNIQSQVDRMLNEDNAPYGYSIQADEMARRVHVALAGYCAHKGDLPQYAGDADAARAVLGTMQREGIQPEQNFGPMYRVGQTFLCTTKDRDALKQMIPMPALPTYEITTEIADPLTTTLTRL